MNINGKRLVMIISDPWDAYRKSTVIIVHSFTFEGAPYFLVRNSRESSEYYLISPRHLGDELFDVFNDNSVSVAIGSLSEAYSSAEYAKLLKSSCYLGIGSIELCPTPNDLKAITVG